MSASDRTEPHCSESGTGSPALGCPACKRYEVRVHVADCLEHGRHIDLECCWCGAEFFAFTVAASRARQANQYPTGTA